MLTGGEANGKFIVFGLQELVSGYCLTPNEQFSIYILARTSNDVYFVLYPQT